MVTIPRVNQIVKNPLFVELSLKNAQAEQKRKFCSHGFDHGLAVARIAYIFLMEEKNTSLSKEVIYAAAVLHDLGRWREYETGKDHAIVGAELVQPILEEAGFTSEEAEIIRIAIREHRCDPNAQLSVLGKALAYADDWARDCQSCKNKGECYKYSCEMDEIVS